MPLPHSRASGRTWVWYGVSFALGVLLTLAVRYWFFPAHLELKMASFPSVGQGARRGNVSPDGPWGKLEYERFPLFNPTEALSEGVGLIGAPRWVFEGFQAGPLSNFINSCPLTANQKAYLSDSGHWERLSNGFAITPSDELVGSLSPAARQKLYSLLGRSPANPPHYRAYRMPLGGLAERFTDGCLPPARTELLRQHAYTNAGRLRLCVDRPLAARFTTNELQCLLRTLSSVPTWMVRLRVMPDSNLEGLVKYWGAGGRENSIRPLLASVARNDRGGRINIADLLPGFARLRLYTFPDPQTDPAVLQQDGFYTALNFFNEKPDPRFFDHLACRQALQNDYAPAPQPATFGDLVVALDPAGKAVHIAVFIADDIVFTKNGANLLQPWALMRIPDMLALIPGEVPVHTAVLRKKPR